MYCDNCLCRPANGLLSIDQKREYCKVYTMVLDSRLENLSHRYGIGRRDGGPSSVDDACWWRSIQDARAGMF